MYTITLGQSGPGNNGVRGLVIIIIMSCCQHGSPWPFLATCLIHYFQEVFQATSYIGTELLYISSSWSSNFCSSMWRGPQEYISYKFVLTSSAVSRMSDSSNLDSFCDGWLVAVQLLCCGLLPQGLVQYSLQHSCVISIKLFLYTFS